MPQTPLSPAERSLCARIAARWAKEPDRLAATAPGRRAAFQKLLDEVDPDGVLPPRERAKRAENARQAPAIQRAQLKACRLARQPHEAVRGIREVRPERPAAVPNGSQLQEQLMRIISEGSLCEEQLIRISELLRDIARVGR